MTHSFYRPISFIESDGSSPLLWNSNWGLLPLDNLPLGKPQITHNGITFHAIQISSGDIWDTYNGWRPKLSRPAQFSDRHWRP